MQAISTYGSVLSQLNAINTTSSQTLKYSNQLSTGSKATDLADNADRTQVLDLTVTKAKRESYVKSCTLAATTTAEYTTSLSGLETTITNALKAVQGVQGSYTGISSSSTDTAETAVNALSAFTDLGQTIDQTMKSVTVALNEQSASGGAYLYSGLRDPTANSTPSYTVPTVSDLSSLPYFLGANSSAPNPAGNSISGYTPPSNAVDAVTTSDLPTYDADFASSRPAASTALTSMANGSRTVSIDDAQTVGVGITSTDSTFQNLVNGLRAAKTACDQAGNYTTDDRDTFVSLAFSSLTKALEGIRSLENKNSVSDAAVQNKSSEHTNYLDLITKRLDSLEGVDTTTVTVQLAAANNQLTASYKATSSMLSLSLMNYLK